MQRQKYITLTAAGTSQAVPLCYYSNGYSIGIVAPTSANFKYTLQHTFSDPSAGNLNSNGVGVWQNHNDSIAVNCSAHNISTNYAFVPTATRIVVASLQASRTLQWSIIANGAPE